MSDPQEEYSKLAEIERNPAWQILVNEFERRQEETRSAVFSESKSPAEAEAMRQRVIGMDAVNIDGLLHAAKASRLHAMKGTS